MNGEVIYFLAQYTPDPVRQEARNVGIVAIKSGELAARFVGEAEAGAIDGRLLRWTENPDVYRKWVIYWREAIGRLHGKSTRTIRRELTAENGGNYNLIAAGEAADTADDSAVQICDELYKTLVVRPEEKLQEQKREVQIAVAHIRRAVRQEFDKRGILGRTRQDVPHPIWANTFVQGKQVSHQPAYVQQNGALWVMDTVDFTIARKTPAVDHSGLMTAMFSDIAAAREGRSVEAVAIVQANNDDLSTKPVQYAMSLLKDVGGARIVNWLNEPERAAFADERERIARSAVAGARDLFE